MIHPRAFENCTSLKEISIPKNVEVIGVEAFKGCSALEGILLDNGLKVIAADAFADCEKLANIYCLENDKPWDNTLIALGNERLTDAKIYYYSASEPTEEGNFWHYNMLGEIEVWEVETDL